MSVRSRRLLVAVVAAAVAVAVPVAALASSAPSGKPAAPPGAASKSAAAASKSSAASEPRVDLLTGEAVHRVRQRIPQAAIVADLQPCLVHVDPAGVDHAICNLIDNAITWNPPDATVHVAVENGRVSVTDHGPGIPDEDLPHIFERFYRASAARGMPGAGLGLAIVARIAQANNATSDVRTGPGGSSFTLAFPPHPRATEVVHDDQGSSRHPGLGRP